jgi:hypothetical protein
VRRGEPQVYSWVCWCVMLYGNLNSTFKKWNVSA